MSKFYYGSDDGYDYSKENREGDVDRYVEWVKEWRKQEEAKKKTQPPKGGD